ncbi:hypothetical protein SK128_010393, partial [Halocaridina rubra]
RCHVELKETGRLREGFPTPSFHVLSFVILVPPSSPFLFPFSSISLPAFHLIRLILL